MSTSWLVDYYTETFRLQPTLRARELKGLIDKDHNIRQHYLCAAGLGQRLYMQSLVITKGNLGR